jgi:hypothetical protein
MATSMRLSPAGVLIDALRGFGKDFSTSYRPELHYMRGPGPRWREKHSLRFEPVPVRLRPAALRVSTREF